MQPEPRQRQPQAAAAAGPLSKRKTVAQHLEEDDASTMFAILLPSGFPLEEGTQLWRGVRLGKLLGAGAQVRAGGRAAWAGCRGSRAAGARRL